MQVNASHLLSRTPPLLNASALLYWGWQCEFLPYAVAMAILIELPRLFHRRINLSDNEFNHVSDLSAIVFLVVIIYVFFTRSYHGIFVILSLLPFLLFLLILAQQYSRQGYVRASALFISLRRYEKNAESDYNVAIDLSYPYFFVCLLSASEGNRHELLFYAGLVLLTGWALWALRPSRAALSGWLLIFLLAIPSGFAVQAGLQKLQAVAESTVLYWLDQFMWRSRDPLRTSTAIGTLGKLKLSDRIVVRVDTDTIGPGQSLLLREASYLNYSHGIWTNYQNTLQLVDPEVDGRTWIINPDIPARESMRISFYMDEERAIIPLPVGLHAIFNVTASEILHSPYGATSLELNPGWNRYDVSFSPAGNDDAPPGPDELDIPDIYRDELKNLAHDLGLPGMDPSRAVKRTERYFLENFQYSLSQTERYPRGRYLSQFLFKTRKGHCEFFATATALLLRAAGISTRYVVGYAIHEYSRLEGQYIGRASHAHSWVQAFVNGRWINIDTTPPVWISQEQADTSLITPLVDLWSWLSYKMAIDDTDTGEDNENTLLLWLLLPLLFYYLWRIISARRSPDAVKDNREAVMVSRQGEDSAFYRLYHELEKLYGCRRRGQTLQQWLAGLSGKRYSREAEPLLHLHYRYRFDPDGLDKQEISEMNSRVDGIINSLQQH